MIVYGDRLRRGSVATLVAELRQENQRLLATCMPEERGNIATGILLRAGELVQGVLDAQFTLRGEDEWLPVQVCCGILLLESARCWRAAHPQDAAGVRVDAQLRVLNALLAELADLLGGAGISEIGLKAPEGFAFYALYPEQFADAARRFAAEHAAPMIVIGLRSIGTTLSGVVAAEVNACLPPVTLRLTGHPFHRRVQASAVLEKLMREAGPDVIYAVVDEGPGLSGSSFCGTADWLDSLGVRPERICYFPGHAGDLGAQASDAHRERWQRSSRWFTSWENVCQNDAASWLIAGAAAAEVDTEDIAQGRWRKYLAGEKENWPAVNVFQERRKYRVRHGSRVLLAKFAGLGQYGEKRLELARLLDHHGLIAPVRDFRRGFVIQDWVERCSSPEAWSLQHAAACASPLFAALQRYLCFLARHSPRRNDAEGASLDELLAMACFNTTRRLGPERAAALERWREHLPGLARRVCRICTDNRMHAWEWLLLPDGRVFKADALEHSAAHDCIGAQDVLWDLVGAAVECDLDETVQEALERALMDAGRRPDSLLRDFYRVCYVAFQMGYYVLSAESHERAYPEEADRLRRRGDWYAGQLAALL